VTLLVVISFIVTVCPTTTMFIIA